MSGYLSSSIGRKVAMSLSAIFLLIFLLQHLVINITSTFSASLFNEISHFMGTNFLVQFVLQPILIFGVIFHFVMGFVLEIRNRKARGKSAYAKQDGKANSSWVSRTMIWSGLVILFFIGLHFVDFWFPEIGYKYVQFKPEVPDRYYHELVEKFHHPIRVGLYVVSFIFLAFHLHHGFSSSFQSIGFNNKYSSGIKKAGKAYAILVPAGFIFIALFLHFTAA